MLLSARRIAGRISVVQYPEPSIRPLLAHQPARLEPFLELAAQPGHDYGPDLFLCPCDPLLSENWLDCQVKIGLALAHGPTSPTGNRKRPATSPLWLVVGRPVLTVSGLL